MLRKVRRTRTSISLFRSAGLAALGRPSNASLSEDAEGITTLAQVGPLHARAVKGFEAALGPKHPLSLLARHNQAVHEFRLLQQKMREGKVDDERPLAADDAGEEELVERSLATPSSPGRTAADRMLSQILADRREVLGSQHPDTQLTYAVLAELRRHLMGGRHMTAYESHAAAAEHNRLGTWGTRTGGQPKKALGRGGVPSVRPTGR